MIDLEFTKEKFKEFVDSLIKDGKAKQLAYMLDDGIDYAAEYFAETKLTNEEWEELTENNTQVWDTFWDKVSDYCSENVKEVYHINMGDGNRIEKVFELLDFPGFFVRVVGRYSSYDSTDWHFVSVAKPYTHSETRYK